MENPLALDFDLLPHVPDDFFSEFPQIHVVFEPPQFLIPALQVAFPKAQHRPADVRFERGENADSQMKSVL